MKVKLITADVETEKAELPMLYQRRVILYNQRFELQALAPLSKPAPLSDAANLRNEEEIEFDGDFLRGKAFRNLTATDIKRLGTVREGIYDVDIFRNGEFINKANVLFTQIPPGALARACITPSLFNLLGVKTNYISELGLQALQAMQAQKTSSTPTNKSTGPCIFISDWVATSTEKFDSGDLRLDLEIPQAYLQRNARQSVPKEMLTRGENAGFVNYTFNSFKSLNVSSNFLALNSGVNLGGWQFRQSSSLSQNDQGQNQYIVGETVLKRPLIEQKANLVIGDTGTNSPVIGGLPIRGVRISSEDALYPEGEREFRPVVKGVARTNARVRVLQNNAVILEQNVPPGPFELPDLNPISSIGNLQVVVSEADGSEQRFVVPFSIAAGKLNPGSYRYSVATGLYRQFTTAQDTKVLQAYVRYGLNSFITPTIDFLAGPNYNNLGLQSSFNSNLGSINFNALFSHLYAPTRQVGQAWGVNVAAPGWRGFNVYAGTNHQSEFYTTPTTALGPTNISTQLIFDRFKRNDFISMGLSLNQLGNLNLGLVQQTSWGSALTSQQYQLGYGVNVYRVNLYASMSRTVYSDNRPRLDAVNLSANIPLNMGNNWNSSLRASADQIGDGAVTRSVSFNSGTKDYSSNLFNYGLNTSERQGNRFSGAYANYQYSFGSLGVSFSGGNGTQQSGVYLSGGLVAHNEGLILTPTLSETFGIVEVPNGLGASLSGSQSQINKFGYGVIPSLSPYYLNDVQVSLESASMGLEIDNATQKVAPVEGSIVKLKYKSSAGRPLALTLSLPDGERIPIGSSILTSEGLEIGTVGQGNRAFVRVPSDAAVLQIVWGDQAQQRCEAAYKLDKPGKAANELIRLKVMCIKPLPSKEAMNQSAASQTVQR